MIAQNGADAAGTSGAGYDLIGTKRGFRPSGNNTFTQVIDITAASPTYGVVFTFTLLAATWDADGGPPLITQKTTEVDAICAHPHVLNFRTEQDQGASDVLYNYAVVTVGTDDGAITDETTGIRMDQINTPAAFGAIDAVWARLVAAGAK